MKSHRLRPRVTAIVWTVATITGVSFAAHAASAQTPQTSSDRVEATTPGRPPQAFGRGVTIYVVPGTALVPPSSEALFGTAGFQRWAQSGQYSAVVIPTGSEVTFFEVEACDTNIAAAAGASLLRCSTATGCLEMAVVNTGFAATPGCGMFVDNTVAQPVIDNDNYYYMIIASTGAPNDTTTIAAVRVGWRREVSPAPGTATFSDVPVGHPFHRFVEALAASGVTGGCGGGNYCPDVPLTRGQMAVFLATALGLHWPN